MYKILITGADGFIGKYLCQEFIKTNHVIIKLSRKYKFKGKAIGDFQKFNQWDKLLVDIDVVIHLAGYVHKNEKNQKKLKNNNFKFNYILTKNLFDASLNASVKQFIFLSTVGIHGKSSNNSLLNEESKINPYSDYTSSKSLSEKYIIDNSKRNKLKYTIIRPPMVYGKYSPGNIDTLLNLILRGIPLPFSNIKNKRSFIGIDNLIDFIILLIMNKKSFNQKFMISDNFNLSTSDFIKKIIIASKSKGFLFVCPKFFIKFVLIVLGKKNLYFSLYNSFVLDTNKVKDILNWTPKFTTEHQINKYFGKK